jgi:hypothetical protein
MGRPRKHERIEPVMAEKVGVIKLSSEDLKVSEINKSNKMQMAQLRKEVLESGLIQLSVKMALTGKEFFIDEFGEIYTDDEMLSPQARLSLINKIIDKSITTPKDSDDDEKEDDGMQRWYEIGKNLAVEDKSNEDDGYDS